MLARSSQDHDCELASLGIPAFVFCQRNDALKHLFFWNFKTPSSNAWHPVLHQHPAPPGRDSSSTSRLPSWLQRADPEALVVDVAPFIVGAGAFAHLRQALDFGFTAHASVFRNPQTLRALHRATNVLVPVVLCCQMLGVEYRNVIPRFAGEREWRREESEVRNHVDVGMAIGLSCWAVRVMGLRMGRTYWGTIDVVLGGALADLMHREYLKAHNVSSVVI
nr:hypothetical protein CFP56_11283 [Quercus suber]